MLLTHLYEIIIINDLLEDKYIIINLVESSEFTEFCKQQLKALFLKID